MRFPVLAVLFAMNCMPFAAPAQATAAAAPGTAAAKTTAPTAIPLIEDKAIGFRYSLPADWEVLTSEPAQPNVPFPTAMAPKKGNACAQVELTARRGAPASVVVVVALPFACYGQALTEKNLPDFASGAAAGLKQTFEITNPVLAHYSLGNHAMWIERAKGTVKGQPGSQYTLEVACTVMAKGAACWMAMAADAASLAIFEQQAVQLEGDAFDAIVPWNALPPAAAAAPNRP